MEHSPKVESMQFSVSIEIERVDREILKYIETDRERYTINFYCPSTYVHHLSLA